MISIFRTHFQALDKKTLGRHLGYYVFFCFLIWLAHLIIISFLTFIHLQLGHNFKVIDEWLFQNAWMLITFSELSSAYIAFNLISIWSERRQLFAPFVRQNWNGVSKKLVVVVCFLWVILCLWSGVSFKLEAELLKNLVSALGIFLFYLLHLFFLESLDEIFPLSKKEKIWQILIFPFLFFFTVSHSFPYKNNWGMEIIFFMMFLLFLYNWNGKNWSDPLFFLWSFVVPTSVLFGNDPLWGATFSYGKLTMPFKAYEWFFVIALSVTYLLFRKHGMLIINSFIRTLKEGRSGIGKT